MKHTSLAAYDYIQDSGVIKLQHEKILEAMQTMPNQEGNAWQISIASGYRKEVVGRRMNELVRDDKVTTTARYAKTDTGRQAEIYKIRITI